MSALIVYRGVSQLSLYGMIPKDLWIGVVVPIILAIVVGCFVWARQAAHERRQLEIARANASMSALPAITHPDRRFAEIALLLLRELGPSVWRSEATWKLRLLLQSDSEAQFNMADSGRRQYAWLLPYVCKVNTLRGVTGGVLVGGWLVAPHHTPQEGVVAVDGQFYLFDTQNVVALRESNIALYWIGGRCSKPAPDTSELQNGQYAVVALSSFGTSMKVYFVDVSISDGVATFCNGSEEFEEALFAGAPLVHVKESSLVGIVVERRARDEFSISAWSEIQVRIEEATSYRD